MVVPLLVAAMGGLSHSCAAGASRFTTYDVPLRCGVATYRTVYVVVADVVAASAASTSSTSRVPTAATAFSSHQRAAMVMANGPAAPPMARSRSLALARRVTQALPRRPA